TMRRVAPTLSGAPAPLGTPTALSFETTASFRLAGFDTLSVSTIAVPASGVSFDGSVVDVVVTGGWNSTSTAPMSHTAVPSPLPSSGRGVPGGSVAGGGQLVPASIAGLPGSSRWVCVGPPLSASGPSPGATPLRSPAAVNMQDPSSSRFDPSVVKVPKLTH